LLSALCAILVREDRVNHAFVQAHCRDFDVLRAALAEIDIAAGCAHAGIAEDTLRQVADRIARAGSVAIQEDLGLQQSPHSTLSSYLEKLVYLLVGSFARRGGMNLHSHFAPLIGKDRDAKTPVSGHRLMQGMVPCNVIPDEILSDHPKRMRAMLVESANPAHSLADSPRMREALAALDTLVVIDVSLSETARLAHYVLPAASQFEKWETTFFNLEFPRNAIQLRAPLFPPRAGTLPEPEIHRRLLRALGAIDDAKLAPLVQAAAAIPSTGRLPFAAAFFAWQAQNPKLAALAPGVLYETLGPTLPDGAQAAAVLWAAAHLCAMSYPESVRRAGFAGEGPLLGEALFDAILHRRSGVVFTVDEPEESWRRIEHRDGRIALAIPELLAELATLPRELAQAATAADAEFPFVLSAGERRTSTANTSLRDPAWRKKDLDGALRLSPQDAARLGIVDGGWAQVTTRRGSATARVEISDTLLPGHATLPNGLGLLYPDASGQPTVSGVAPNELTSSGDRDWLAGTPWHKHVRAQIVARL
jgi:formate dehydrogenase